MTNNEDSAKSVGDQNVERLVTEAYHPESPDADFVERVEERLVSEAARREEPSAPATSSNPSRAKWTGRLGWAAALSLLIVVAVLIIRQGGEPKPYYDGPTVWIDGKPYVPADSQSPAADGAPVLKPANSVPPAESVMNNDKSPQWVGTAGITPRQRKPQPEIATVKTGASIVTERGQRRRLQLADGSILLINERSQVEVTGARQISVKNGEVFIDRSCKPRCGNWKPPEPNRRPPGFTGKEAPTGEIA